MTHIAARISRHLENLGFAVAIAGGAGYIVAEILVRIGICPAASCEHRDNSFPWGLFFMMVLLVAPKVLGRATAGQFWVRLVEKIPGFGLGQKSGRPTDDPPPDA